MDASHVQGVQGGQPLPCANVISPSLILLYLGLYPSVLAANSVTPALNPGGELLYDFNIFFNDLFYH
jgi:hypothetical protein